MKKSYRNERVELISIIHVGNLCSDVETSRKWFGDHCAVFILIVSVVMLRFRSWHSLEDQLTKTC
jgi:hypothetical protein